MTGLADRYIFIRVTICLYFQGPPHQHFSNVHLNHHFLVLPRMHRDNKQGCHNVNAYSVAHRNGEKVT